MSLGQITARIYAFNHLIWHSEQIKWLHCYVVWSRDKGETRHPAKKTFFNLEHPDHLLDPSESGSNILQTHVDAVCTDLRKPAKMMKSTLGDLTITWNPKVWIGPSGSPTTWGLFVPPDQPSGFTDTMTTKQLKWQQVTAGDICNIFVKSSHILQPFSGVPFRSVRQTNRKQRSWLSLTPRSLHSDQSQ